MCFACKQTESNKNYEQTMIDVKAYLKSINVPAQYFQYDSWYGSLLQVTATAAP